jgi:peptidoglycan/xylan/chitin deacetylase (PgdA/CDA1 family)
MWRRALPVAVAALAAGCGGGGGGADTATVTRAPATTTAAHRHAPRARRFVALHRPASVTPRTVRVPILTYHRVHKFATEYTKSIPDETVEPGTFAAEMAALRRGGFHTVSQRALFGALFHGAKLPPKPVLVSVDDGYVDAVTNILPVLRREHMVATFYVITGRTHEQGFLNPTEIRRLDRAEMDVGAHTRTHVPLAQTPTAQAWSQIDGSRRDLARILGHPVYWFAYPYGSNDAAVQAQVKRSGYLLAVTTAGGETESSMAPYALPRYHVGRSASPASVVACAGGGCGGGSSGE